MNLTETVTELGPLPEAKERRWRHLTNLTRLLADGRAVAYCGEVFRPLGIWYLGTEPDICPDCKRKSQ